MDPDAESSDATLHALCVPAELARAGCHQGLSRLPGQLQAPAGPAEATAAQVGQLKSKAAAESLLSLSQII